MADETKNIMEEDDDIIVLSTDDGVEEEFYHIATIDYKEKWYVFLHPVEDREDIAEDEALIFEVTENEDGDDVFNLVEDDDLLDKIYEEYLSEVNKLEQNKD